MESIELQNEIARMIDKEAKEAKEAQNKPKPKRRQKMVELTEHEAASLCDYLETFFIQNVKDDPDVDSMVWMDNMLTIWRKCGGRKNYDDGEADHD